MTMKEGRCDECQRKSILTVSSKFYFVYPTYLVQYLGTWYSTLDDSKIRTHIQEVLERSLEVLLEEIFVFYGSKRVAFFLQNTARIGFARGGDAEKGSDVARGKSPVAAELHRQRPKTNDCNVFHFFSGLVKATVATRYLSRHGVQ